MEEPSDLDLVEINQQESKVEHKSFIYEKRVTNENLLTSFGTAPVLHAGQEFFCRLYLLSILSKVFFKKL